MPQEKIKISYIILTYNRFDTILYHIRSIRLQDYLCDKLEIVVADDGSADIFGMKFVEALAQSGVSIRYVNTGNYNKATPAKARNLGIEAATGDLLIFADDDCLPHPKLIEEYQKTKKGYCSVGYRSSTKDRLGLELSLFNVDRGLEDGNPKKYWQRQKDGIFDYMHFASGSFAIWREDLADVRFDEEFEGYGYEDRHFAFLLHKKGLKFEYMPKAIIYHDNRAGNRPREQKDIEKIKNKEIYERKLKA